MKTFRSKTMWIGVAGCVVVVIAFVLLRRATCREHLAVTLRPSVNEPVIRNRLTAFGRAIQAKLVAQGPEVNYHPNNNVNVALEHSQVLANNWDGAIRFTDEARSSMRNKKIFIPRKVFLMFPAVPERPHGGTGIDIQTLRLYVIHQLTMHASVLAVKEGSQTYNESRYELFNFLYNLALTHPQNFKVLRLAQKDANQHITDLYQKIISKQLIF